jgi:hypothetical protein
LFLIPVLTNKRKKVIFSNKRMLKYLHIEQFFYRSISTLLIAVIAVVCLKINGNTGTGCRSNKDITHQFTCSLIDKNPRINFITPAFRSNPHTDILVLEQVIDGQVYTPDNRIGKASSIKNNLSLAKHRIVTAAYTIA